MFTFASETATNRPAGEAYGLLTDLEKYPQWQSGVVQSAVIDPGEVHVGTRFEETVRMGMWKIKTQCRITALVPQRTVAFQAESGHLSYQGRFELHPTERGARIVLTGSGNTRGWWRLLEPMLAAEIRREAPEELDRFRELLEGGAPGKPSTGGGPDTGGGMAAKALVLAVFLFASGALAQTGNGKPSAEAARSLEDIKKTVGFVPRFFNEIPEAILPGAWEEMKTLQMNPNTALPPKVKELIGLGVAAQIPCQYCIEAHTVFARSQGASRAEIGEAVSMAAVTRHWSTFLNGIQTDETAFREEIRKLIERMQAPPAEQGMMAEPAPVTDAKSALDDIGRSFGFVPEFLKKFPEAALPAAWKTMKAVEMNPNTALSGKYKSLISVAVAAQIPCKFCLISDTEFARLEGASEAEIAEAVAMSSFTRQMSTLLNGMNVDEKAFRADLSRMVKPPQKGP